MRSGVSDCIESIILTRTLVAKTFYDSESFICNLEMFYYEGSRY